MNKEELKYLEKYHYIIAQHGTFTGTIYVFDYSKETTKNKNPVNKWRTKNKLNASLFTYEQAKNWINKLKYGKEKFEIINIKNDLQ